MNRNIRNVSSGGQKFLVHHPSRTTPHTHSHMIFIVVTWFYTIYRLHTVAIHNLEGFLLDLVTYVNAIRLRLPSLPHQPSTTTLFRFRFVSEQKKMCFPSVFSVFFCIGPMSASRLYIFFAYIDIYVAIALWQLARSEYAVRHTHTHYPPHTLQLMHTLAFCTRDIRVGPETRRRTSCVKRLRKTCTVHTHMTLCSNNQQYQQASHHPKPAEREPRDSRTGHDLCLPREFRSQKYNNK